MTNIAAILRHPAIYILIATAMAGAAKFSWPPTVAAASAALVGPQLSRYRRMWRHARADGLEWEWGETIAISASAAIMVAGMSYAIGYVAAWLLL